jgi:hypothetical protein
MEYDPHGSELLDRVMHYVRETRGRIWAKALRKDLDQARCDTDLFIALTKHIETGSPSIQQQATELAESLSPSSLD